MQPLHKPFADDLEDTQREVDHRGVTIDRVGIKDLRFPVQVRCKSGELQHTVATVTLTVELTHRQKGTHMSRFVEALGTKPLVLDIREVGALLLELRTRLSTPRAQANFTFPFFTEKAAPATGSVGLMDYTVYVAATSDDGRDDVAVTVIVPVTTLCPCSKAISENGAHNQRGIITYASRSARPVPIEDLIALAESCASSELYSVLKRPDEKAVTERAFERPAFVEDVVRDLAGKSEMHPDITWYRIEAENFESIHNHSAYAMIEKK